MSLLKEFLRQGADKDRALYKAALGGQTQLITALVKKGGSIDQAVLGIKEAGYIKNEKDALQFLVFLGDHKVREKFARAADKNSLSSVKFLKWVSMAETITKLMQDENIAFSEACDRIPSLTTNETQQLNAIKDLDAICAEYEKHLIEHAAKQEDDPELTAEKIIAITDLRNTLKLETGAQQRTPQQIIQDFDKKLKQHYDTLEKRRESAFRKFIKAVTEIMAALHPVAYVGYIVTRGLWSETTGKTAAKNMQAIVHGPRKKPVETKEETNVGEKEEEGTNVKPSAPY